MGILANDRLGEMLSRSAMENQMVNGGCEWEQRQSRIKKKNIPTVTKKDALRAIDEAGKSGLMDEYVDLSEPYQLEGDPAISHICTKEDIELWENTIKKTQDMDKYIQSWQKHPLMVILKERYQNAESQAEQKIVTDAIQGIRKLIHFDIFKGARYRKEEELSVEERSRRYENYYDSELPYMENPETISRMKRLSEKLQAVRDKAQADTHPCLSEPESDLPQMEGLKEVDPRCCGGGFSFQDISKALFDGELCRMRIESVSENPEPPLEEMREWKQQIESESENEIALHEDTVKNIVDQGYGEPLGKLEYAGKLKEPLPVPPDLACTQMKIID